MQSCLYEGWVEHRRALPAVHRFRYSLALVYLDLAELDELFAHVPSWLCSRDSWSPLNFRRSDYLGEPGQPLAESVRQLLVDRGYPPPAGPIRLLTQFRQFGYVFNPVSFYYCFAASGELERVIAEVSNTPWGERHWYVLEAAQADGKFPLISKEFHVSPFMHLDLQYRWQVSPPAQRLTLGIENLRAGEPFFDVEMNLARRAMTGGNLARMLMRYFLQPQRVMAGIYWQALWLWWKGVPYVPHPQRGAPAAATEPTTPAEITSNHNPEKIAS